MRAGERANSIPRSSAATGSSSRLGTAMLSRSRPETYGLRSSRAREGATRSSLECPPIRRRTEDGASTAPAHHHHQHGASRAREPRALKLALGLIIAFMAVEVTAGIIVSSLALLSDAAHMVIDAAALALALVAARVARRPAQGAMTYGLGRVEILSAQGNGATLLVLALVIVYVAIRRLLSPPEVGGGTMIAVACAGIVVNLLAARILSGDGQPRSLNLEGSYRHILTDLYGFIATAVAGVVILATGFGRADAIASLVVAALMLRAAYGLLKESGRVFLEAAPAGIEPAEIGKALAAHPEVVEVHDLHVWEVTSGFPA